jgi:ArsR family transcriptional regulator, arsenate/arsenite/antimonite-responsive transcriptional repressor
MDKVFKSLADINRRKILTILKDKDLTVNEILPFLGIKQATLSSHLAILRKAGLVEFKISGKQRIYKLNRETLISFVKKINGFVEFEKIGTENEIIVRRKSE